MCNSTIIKAVLQNDINGLSLIYASNPEIQWSKVQQQKTGETIMHMAAERGYIELIKYLLKTNQNNLNLVNIRSNDCSTPLHVAAQHSKQLVVEYLLNNGADVNAIRRGDWTPLALACTKPGMEANDTIETLLKYGASMTFANKDGWTPFMVACRTGDYDICCAMVQVFPENLFRSSKTKRSPLHILCYHGHSKILKHIYPTLVSDPSLINAKDACGTTPFLDAVYSGDVDLVKYLAGIDCTNMLAVNNEGWNALHIAVNVSNKDMCEYLINSLGFSVNCQTEDHRKLTPLHCAARAQANGCVENLLKNGADESIRDWQDRSFQDYLKSCH